MRPLFRRGRRALRVGNANDDVHRELHFHLQLLIEDLEAEGFSHDAAVREARRRFGAADDAALECLTISRRSTRRARRADRMFATRDDVVQAARAVRKSPLLTLIVSLTLMLGIGATTAIYSIVRHVILEPLPYPGATRVVSLVDNDGNTNPIAFPEYDALRRTTRDIFEEIGVFFGQSLTLTGVDEPTILDGARMSASVGRIVGVHPIIGRALTDADDSPHSQRVIMLSDACWHRVFGGDPRILGRVLTLQGAAFTVVGIYPSTSATALPNEITSGHVSDFWEPLRLDAARSPLGLHYLSAIARARPSLSIGTINARLRAARAQIHALAPNEHNAVAIPLADRLVGPVRPLLWLFLGAVGLVLLIACANVAGLLIARAATRQRELAVRAALGAGAWRIGTQLVAESVLRALLGGVLGVGFAFALLGVLRATAAFHVPRMSEVHLDGAVLLFAFILALLTGVACGLVPALRAGRMHLAPALRDGGRGTQGSLGDDRFRRGLVVAEIALSFALLVGAGLLLESFSRLMHVEKGFQPDHVVTALLSLPTSRYPDGTRENAFYDEMLVAVRALPGVAAAGLTSALPVEGGTNGGVEVEGKVYSENDKPSAEKRIVSTGYFEAIGAAVSSGRVFTAQDASGAPAAALVNRTFVDRYLDGRVALGRRVDFNWETTGHQAIVGVLQDMREGALSDRSQPAIYVPLAQRPNGSMYVVVRTAVDPSSIIPALRAAVLRIDPQLPLGEVRLLNDVVAANAGPQRTGMSLLGAFAVAAVVLAALGLYGVISYAVLQRTREFGVRTALGASQGRIVGLVARQAAGMVMIGLALGVLLARWGARFLSGQLFGVQPGSSATYAIVALLLGTIAGLAVVIPAVRAARIDPLEALRAE